MQIKDSPSYQGVYTTVAYYDTLKMLRNLTLKQESNFIHSFIAMETLVTVAE